MKEFNIESSEAFNTAMALESIGNIGDFNPSNLTYNNVSADSLVSYARIVAYKVFHNLQNGLKMQKEDDPITVDNIPASIAWAEHYD